MWSAVHCVSAIETFLKYNSNVTNIHIVVLQQDTYKGSKSHHHQDQRTVVSNHSGYNKQKTWRQCQGHAGTENTERV